MDRYSDYQALGTSKTGPVFRAQITATGQPVLVKQIPKDGQGAFPLQGTALKPAEAALMAPRGFPWVAILGIGEDEHCHYVISEYLQAPTAAQHPQKGSMDSATALDVLNQFVSALAELERMRLTHGDIKPSNTLIAAQPDGRPHVKLTDCGLSRFRKALPPETLIFTAPERLAGSQATIAADLFSVAHVVYFLLTGFSLVRGSTAPEIVTAWKTADPANLKKQRKDLDAKLVKILLSLLEKNPAKRPASAAAVLKELAALRPPHLPQPAPAPAANRQAAPTRPVAPRQPTQATQPAVPLAAMRPPPEVAAQMGWAPSPTAPIQTGNQQSIPVAARTQPMGAPTHQGKAQPNYAPQQQAGYAQPPAGYGQPPPGYPPHGYQHPGMVPPPQKTGLIVMLTLLFVAMLGAIGFMVWKVNSVAKSNSPKENGAPKMEDVMDKFNKLPAQK